MKNRSNLAVLENLSADEWETFTGYAERIELHAGDTVIQQGQGDRALFIVLVGRAQVSVRSGATDHVIAEIGPGELFGELSFLDGQPRSATVRASTSGTVLRLTREAFDRMNSRDSRLAATCLLELGRVLALRFRRQTGQLLS
jgi:CRP/FNR family cyclic AMP-dependent transcriptional regulator